MQTYEKKNIYGNTAAEQIASRAAANQHFQEHNWPKLRNVLLQDGKHRVVTEGPTMAIVEWYCEEVDDWLTMNLLWDKYRGHNDVQHSLNAMKWQKFYCLGRYKTKRKEKMAKAAEAAKMAARRSNKEWTLWLAKNEEVSNEGIHLVMTDGGWFVFDIAEGRVTASRSVSTKNSGSELWLTGKIISRNTGDLIVLPYIRNSDNKCVNGYTRRGPGQVDFAVRTKEEVIKWKAAKEHINADL